MRAPCFFDYRPVESTVRHPRGLAVLREVEIEGVIDKHDGTKTALVSQ